MSRAVKIVILPESIVSMISLISQVPASNESGFPRVWWRVRHPTNLALVWNSASDATVMQIRTQILSGDDTAFSGLSHHPAVSCNADPGGRPVSGPSLALSQERSLAPSPTQKLLIDLLAVAVKDLNLICDRGIRTFSATHLNTVQLRVPV